MAFRAEVSPRALADLDQIASYIRENAGFDRAEEWFNGILDCLASLQQFPHRCQVAGESEDLGQMVRYLLYGKRNHKYKVYFSLRSKSRTSGTVQILHIRHWAQRGLSHDELDQLTEKSAN